MSNTTLKRKGDEVYLSMKRARRNVIHDLANKIIGGDKQVMTISYHIYPWLTRDMVNGCIRRCKKRDQASRVQCVDLATEDTAVVQCVDLATEDTAADSTMVIYNDNNKGGRPKGSTTVSKLDIENKIELAKNEIAILYKTSKDKKGGRMKKGSYKTVHDSVFNKHGITINTENSIQYECIRKRIFRMSLTVDAQQNNPPTDIN